MKKTILKAALALILVCATVFCFASCGNSAAKVDEAESADGSFDGIDWEYDSKTQTLTIEGSGAINFDSADDADWKEVRHSVQEIEFDTNEITEIGDYAFYYMPELTEIEIPESVTRLGDYAFAFCSSLESIDGQLPMGLESIGEGCFESCIALETINVPSSVKSIGARAFAHCAALEVVDISASLSSIEKWTFKGCSALDSLTLHESNKEIAVDDAAFEDCEIDFSDVEFSASKDGKVMLTVKYVYEDGTEAGENYTEELTKNAHYEVGSPAIDGYTADPAVAEGYATKDTEITVTYKKVVEAEEETEAGEEAAEEETEAEEPKSKVGNIIAIVIMVVVIVAIIGLVIFMVISDKKNAAKGNGARSAKNGKNDKKKK